MSQYVVLTRSIGTPLLTSSSVNPRISEGMLAENRTRSPAAFIMKMESLLRSHRATRMSSHTDYHMSCRLLGRNDMTRRSARVSRCSQSGRRLM